MDDLYAGDSFYTLSGQARVGLVVLSGLLAAITVLAGRALALRVGRLTAVPFLAFGLIWAFGWLTPQAYYLYYQMIFDGLPWQIVIKWPPPSMSGTIATVLFQGERTLSHDTRGALFWVLIVFMTVSALRSRRQ